MINDKNYPSCVIKTKRKRRKMPAIRNYKVDIFTTVGAIKEL